MIGGGWQFGMAATLLFGSSAGWASPGYGPMFGLVPRPVHGAAFAVGALFAFVAVWRPRWARLALLVATFLSVGWASGFVAAWWLGRLTGLSAPVTYAAVAAFWTATLARGERL